MAYEHVSVMLDEAVHYLGCRPAHIVVDGTLGGAGHARAICRKIDPDGLLIGIDQDLDAIVNAREVLAPYRPSVRLFHDNFANLEAILQSLDLPAVDGVLLDLGLSRHQLEASGRGFSFKREEPLDMRMNQEARLTARELVNSLDEQQLRRVFFQYGEERLAKQIARRIVAERRRGPITTSTQLAQIVNAAVPARSSDRRRIHPATRVFMALRIAVNQELERLEAFMANAVDLLNPGGRLCVLAFHSLEDRIVKHHFNFLARGCICPPDFPQCVCNKQQLVRVLTPRAVKPTQAEISANPLARSARLRAVEKLPAPDAP